MHFTHCLYYISDRPAAIDRALQTIGSDGLVLIIHQTTWGIIQVQQRFLKRIKGNDREMFSSWNIQEILETLHIPYRLEVLEAHIDVSECFISGSVDGEALLSFFLESDVRGLNPVLKQEVVEYLYELSYPEKGAACFIIPWRFFVWV